MIVSTRVKSAAVRCVINRRIPLLIAAGLLIAFAIEPASRLSYDRSLASMFSDEDIWLTNYQENKRLFGGLDTCAVVVSDPELVTVAGLERLERLTAEVEKAPGIQGVVSLAHARRPSSPLNARPLSEQLRGELLSAEQLRDELINNNVYRGTFIGTDGTTAIIVATLKPVAEADVAHHETIAALRKIADAERLPTFVTGEPVLIHDVFESLEEDGRRLSLWSTVLMVLVVGFLFRNLRWVLLPLVVVHASILWTKATLVVSGVQMTMVSSPLVALLTVIGVATVVHVTIRFRDRRSEAEPYSAMRFTIERVGPAVLWTCITTAVGFGALIFSAIVPVKNFGFMMAVGAIFVFVAAATIIPAGALLGGFATDPKSAPGEGQIVSLLNRLIRAVEKHPAALLGGIIVALMLALAGCFRLKVVSDFADNFRESSDIVKSYRYLVKHMGTVASFDILIPSGDELAKEDFDKIRSLQVELQKVPGVMKSISLVDLIDLVKGDQGPQSSLLSRFSGALVDQAVESLPETTLRLLDRMRPGFVRPFWNPDHRVFRIVVQLAPRKGAEAKKTLIQRVERLAEGHYPAEGDSRKVKVAGGYLLLTNLVESLMADQWITFGLAVGGIFLVMSAVFQSPRLGLIALLPNATPIVILVGAMGWIGLPVNIATAMLASVSMGISVDFSIHYITRFNEERNKGYDLYDALRQTHSSVGRAMFLANIALIAGFSALTVSSFIPTVHFGILVSVAMFGGLLGNLIILPLLLRWAPKHADRPGGQVPGT